MQAHVWQQRRVAMQNVDAFPRWSTQLLPAAAARSCSPMVLMASPPMLSLMPGNRSSNPSRCVQKLTK
jgi:hypothetical protein